MKISITIQPPVTVSEVTTHGFAWRYREMCINVLLLLLLLLLLWLLLLLLLSLLGDRV